MKLDEIYKSEKPVISYEIFPPKGETEEIGEKIENLISELRLLSKFSPAFISVTYGAGGSNQQTSLEVVLKIKKDLNISPMPHFTCVGTVRDKINDYLKTIQDEGIINILALRGDPPKGETKFVKPENGFGYANELVEFINFNTDLGIAVAGYPEGHQECESLEHDIINLKRKVDAGANVIITQLFYENKLFYEFVEKTQKAGINVPIIPGILPITNLKQIEKIASLCSCTLPKNLMKKLKANENDNNAMKEIGLDFAIEQCQDLLANGVKGLHFYTLNKASSTMHILGKLSI